MASNQKLTSDQVSANFDSDVTNTDISLSSSHRYSEVGFRVTEVLSERPCTKEFSIVDGEVCVELNIGVSKGSARVRYFTGISEFYPYVKNISSRGEYKCLYVTGIPVVQPGDNGNYEVRAKRNSTIESIGLTKACFEHRREPSPILFDHDPPELLCNAKHVLSIDDGSFIDCIDSTVPELNIKDVDRIEKYSTSAGIEKVDSEGKKTFLKSSPGSHIHMIVSDAERIPELLRTIHVRAFLQGKYCIEPTKLGQGKIITCVDPSPGNPYTPRIVSGAKINPKPKGKKGTYVSLEQAEIYRQTNLIKGKLRIVDMDKLVPLSEDELKRYTEGGKKVLNEYDCRPMVAMKIAKNKGKLSKQQMKLSSRSRIDIERNVDTMVDRGEISGDFELNFDDVDEAITARKLAGHAGEDCDGRSLADPLDPSPENKGKAMFFWNGGINPCIHSFKHGRYVLKVRAEEQLSSNDWMNRHHAQVFISNKMLYAVDKHHTGKIALFDDRLSFISAIDLKAMYAGEYAHDEQGNVITDSKGKPYNKVDYWLKYPGRNRFNSITFEPVPGLQEDDYEPLNLQNSMLNTYKGFAVTPVKWDVSPLLDYILNVICNGDEALADYVTKWIARMVQKPHLPAQTALVIKSKEGTGKTLFWCLTIGSFFGVAFFETANGDDVLGNFNGPLANVVYVNFNEATFAGDKTVQGKLKQLITDDSITIRKMYQEARQCKNYAHFVFTSNNSWVVGVGESDRRFVIFEMAQKQSESYYKNYVEWLNNGGRENALYYFLNDVDISGFDPRKIPAAGGADSESKLDQQLESAGNMTNFMLHLLSQHRFNIKTKPDVGGPSFDKAGIDCDSDDRYFLEWVSEHDSSDAILTIPKDVLYEEFKVFCRDRKWGSPPNMTTLGRFLKGSIPGEGDEVFAVECQKFKDIYPTGKRWRFSLQGVVNSLNSRLNTTRIGNRVDIWDVISSESRFPLPNDDEEDFLA